MKISYNWLQNYLRNQLTPSEISAILTGTGLEVENLESFSKIKGGLEGLVIGKVLEVKKHPNADRLNLTRVDTGLPEPLAIVCGASNVAPGLKVVVAPVGTFVHPVHKESFQILKNKIRGEWSEGMLCAEDEIGLGHSHEGIMILPEDAPIGLSLSGFLKLNNDWVFEIGITPNRSDALSHRGTARDILAFLRTPTEHLAAEADLGWLQPQGKEETIKVILDSEDCTRFSGISISGIEVRESPDWLKEYLSAIGLRPINNIVDITNFICHDLGQPMHAYDLSKIKGAQIHARNFPEGTLFKTLDGVERKLSGADLMISDEERALGIAGVFGGLESGITEQTQSVFLEAACFNPVAVRKTARRHNLKTDASFRFERGTDPNLTLQALGKACRLVLELAGGYISSSIQDLYPKPLLPPHVILRRSRLDSLIGQHIPVLEVNLILKGLGILILDQTDTEWELEIPLFKTDVIREADVIEEVLRIYGLNSVQAPAHLRSSLPFSQKADPERIQDATADWLSSKGFNEILTNSLSASAYLKYKGPESAAQAIQILNPLSMDLDVLRQTLLYSGLKTVAYNRNRKLNDLKFYEFGKTYHLIEGKYVERQRLGIFLCGNENAESWLNKGSKLGIYHLKGYAASLLERLNVDVQEEAGNIQWLQNSISWKTKKIEVAFAGLVNPDLLNSFGIDSDVLYAEFAWADLLKFRDKKDLLTREVPRFPSVRRDLSLLVDQDLGFSQLKSIALNAGIEILSDVQIFDVYKGDKIEKGRKSYALSFTLESKLHTLTDAEIDEAMDKLIGLFEKSSDAIVRK